MTFVCNLVTLSCDFWTQATSVPAVPQSEEDCHLLGGLGLPPTAPTCTRIITEVQWQGLKIINVHFFTFDFTFEIRIWDAKIKNGVQRTTVRFVKLPSQIGKLPVNG